MLSRSLWQLQPEGFIIANMVATSCWSKKMGLKKGLWTPEEDLILKNYVKRYGHKNWRDVPHQTGLLRCGKSCRLRWVNYLRPDIKRGNFTKEEENTIMELHEMWGNRWSAIAARLPGRTDNEIKNVWHTQLKKRLPQHTLLQSQARNQNAKQIMKEPTQEQEQPVMNFTPTITSNSNEQNSDLSANNVNDDHDMFVDNNNAEPLGEDFWSQFLSDEDNSDIGANLSGSSSVHHNMDFWQVFP